MSMGVGAADSSGWCVKLTDGSLVDMTVDELATAFETARVHARTPVRRRGESTWTTLGEAAGLEEDDEEPYSIAPVATDTAQRAAVDALGGVGDVGVVSAPSRSPRVLGVLGVLGVFVVLLALGA